jgi:hypothetical protein
MWDSVAGKPTAVLNHHTAEACGLQANFDTKKFISTGFDGKVLYHSPFSFLPHYLLI